jgi:hypothetical protein
MPSTCKEHVKYKQQTCKIQAKNMSSTCKEHVKYKQRTSQVHAKNVINTSKEQVKYVQNPSKVQVKYKQIRCADFTSCSQAHRVIVSGKSSEYCNVWSGLLQRDRMEAGAPSGPFPRQSATVLNAPFVSQLGQFLYQIQTGTGFN